MAVDVLDDVKLWFDGYDFSGNMNSCGLNYSAEVQDITCFGDDTRTKLGGLKGVTVQHEGVWHQTPDAQLFSRIGLNNTVLTMAPLTGADGERAFSMQALLGSYAPGGAVGEVFKFSVSGESDGALVRSTIMHNATRTTSGNGTGRQLGAIASGQNLYAALHVISASGTSPTLDVDIESDDNSGFTSAVTRDSFAQKTAIGSEWLTIAGPITDDYWRIAFTLGGTSPSFEFIVSIGIQ